MIEGKNKSESEKGMAIYTLIEGMTCPICLNGELYDCGEYLECPNCRETFEQFEEIDDNDP